MPTPSENRLADPPHTLHPDALPPYKQQHAATCAYLLALSEYLYARWESDAAFYVLQAARAFAIEPDQYRAVWRVAVQRRDEGQTVENGVTAANSGAFTSDRDEDRGGHGLVTYAALADHLESYWEFEREQAGLKVVHGDVCASNRAWLAAPATIDAAD
jgi:hypothetical protein